MVRSFPPSALARFLLQTNSDWHSQRWEALSPDIGVDRETSGSERITLPTLGLSDVDRKLQNTPGNLNAIAIASAARNFYNPGRFIPEA